MRLQLAEPQGRGWLQDLLYYMLTDSPDYCYVFHNVETMSVNQPFAFVGDNPPLPIPAAVCMDKETMRLMLVVYNPLVSRLPYNGQIALLKHEGVHIMDGHFSSYGLSLIDRFGPMLSNIAMDCYVNQKPFLVQNGNVVTTIGKVLEDVGMAPATIERFGLPPGLSSEQYAELLSQMDMSGAEVQMVGGGFGPDGDQSDDQSDGQIGDAPADPQAGESGKPGEDFTGKGQYRPMEVFDLDSSEATMADQATRDVIVKVQEAIKAHGEEAETKGLGRGFGGSDSEQFFKAAERTATVPWFYYLRAAETRNRAEFVVPTRRRLSRRCEYHLGRVRRYGLEVVVMVDTSMSMGAEQLRLVDPELRGMHSRGAHITVIHCDAAVAKVETYSPHTPLENFSGRGGTEFSDALLKTRELYPRPGLFVGYTDGYGGIETYVRAIKKERGAEWYDEFCSRKPTISPDGIETLWLIPEGSMSPEEFAESIVPWGGVIVVPALEPVEV